MKSARPTRVATRRSNVGCSPNNSVTAGIRKNSHMFQISHNRMRERTLDSGNSPVLFGLLICVLFNSYTLSALCSECGNCRLHSIFETTRIVHRFLLHSTAKPGVHLAFAVLASALAQRAGISVASHKNVPIFRRMTANQSANEWTPTELGSGLVAPSTTITIAPMIETMAKMLM